MDADAGRFRRVESAVAASGSSKHWPPCAGLGCSVRPGVMACGMTRFPPPPPIHLDRRGTAIPEPEPPPDALEYGRAEPVAPRDVMGAAVGAWGFGPFDADRAVVHGRCERNGNIVISMLYSDCHRRLRYVCDIAVDGSTCSLCGHAGGSLILLAARAREAPKEPTARRRRREGLA